MSNHAFKDAFEKLRSPDRIKLLEIERVIEHCLEHRFITKVLDIGTGTGLFAESFALRNLDVLGVDSQKEMVEEASNLVRKASFKQANVGSLPFKKGSFDLVFMGHVLHEVENVDLAIAEAVSIASVRVCILEWPYRTETIGPPIEHRLTKEQIQKSAIKSKIKKVNTVELNNTVLYKMDVY